MPIGSPFPTEITVCWWAEQQIKVLEENSAKRQIVTLATEAGRYYTTISIWNSGKREANGYDVSCGSRISNLFLQVCCSAPLILTLTVGWITLPSTTRFCLPKNDPTTVMLVLKQLVTGSAGWGGGYYSLLLNRGWNVNLFTVPSGSSVQPCSAPQVSDFPRAEFAVWPIGVFRVTLAACGSPFKRVFL